LADLAPWSALILKLGSVEQEADDEEEQIVGILKEQLAGVPVAEVCHRHGISDATFYT
jgi:putative transposase